MSSEIRLTGGAIVMQDAARRVIERGEVAFDPATGRITYAGEVRGDGDAAGSGRLGAATDVTGCVVMPGLVNAHTHSGMTPLRGYAEDMNLQDWLAKVRAFEVRLGAEDLRAGLELALIEMLKTGTTTFADMFLWDRRMLESVVTSGMRVLAAPAVFGYDAVGYPAASPSDGRAVLDLTERLAAEFAGDGQIRLAFGPHAPYTCTPEMLADVAARAGRLGLPIQIHLSESAPEVDSCLRDYGRTPVAHAAACGIFDHPVLVAHCTHPTDAEIELLAGADAAVAHNPVSNLKLGAGIAPVRRFLDAGVRLGLGTDSVASNNNLDLFEEIKTGILMQRGVHRSPDIVRSGDFLDMATCGGAAAVRFPEVGVLEAGRPADIVILDATGTRATPLYDAASYLAFAASGSADVRDVYVAGRHVVAGGRVTSLDEAAVRERVAHTAARVRRELAAPAT